MKPSNSGSMTFSEPLVGRTLGKYTIKRLIGRGGMGLVYLAAPQGTQHEVVVKVLAPNWLVDSTAVARFEREAKRLSALKHPNIVEMLDYGHQLDGDYQGESAEHPPFEECGDEEHRRAYLVMEYIRGELLSKFLSDRGSLTLREFVPIAAQILKATGYAHSHELMLRDIKPSNVMLCERKGRANFVKVLDFGLAKRLKGEQTLTQGQIIGTVGYVAPEAIRGETIDLRVDVYALGVLFYTMLSGRPLFEKQSMASVFYKTVNTPPPPLEELLPEGHNVPPGLIDLIHRCLEKNPKDRPNDANDVVEQLIDVVPSSYFRLPPAAAPRDLNALSRGAGNTGLHEMLRSSSPSGDFDVSSGHGLISTAGSTASGRLKETITVPSTALETRPNPPMPSVPRAEPPGSVLRRWPVVGGLSALGGVFVAATFCGVEQTAPPAPATTVASANPQAMREMQPSAPSQQGETALALQHVRQSPATNRAVVQQHLADPPTVNADDLRRVNDALAMQKTDFAERHLLLARIEHAGHAAKVNRNLHVSLDLIQAGQSSNPCQTFDTALSAIEQGNASLFATAIASVEGPPGGSGCAGQSTRLAALKRGLEADEDSEESEADEPPPKPKARPRAKPRRRAKKKKATPRSDTKASTPQTAAVTTRSGTASEPVPETKKKKRSGTGSIASVLDDGVRPMGD